MTHYLLVALVLYLFALGTFPRPGKSWKPYFLKYAVFAALWPAALGVVLAHQMFDFKINYYFRRPAS